MEASAGSLHILAYTVAALLPVANPFGLAAPFYAMTEPLEAAERRALAWRVAINFFLLVTGTLVLGTIIMRLFDITLGIVDIAGGLVLFHAAWTMMHSVGEGADPYERSAREASGDIAFFPLTMPLTVDGAVLAVTISLSGSMHNHWEYAVLHEYVAAVLGIAVVSLVVAVCYGTAHSTVGRLGRTGIDVVTVITAFLLLGVATEIVVTGVSDAVRAYQSA